MLRTGLGLSATNYAQSLATASENIKIFLKEWNPVEVFKEHAWAKLEADLESNVEPESFMKSLIKSVKTSGHEIEGLDFGVFKESLLHIAEIRTQNRVFRSMTEDQKLWTMANSGKTQTWTQTLPLTHLDNCLTNFEFRAIYRRRARIPVYTGAMKCSACKNLTADRYGDHTLRCENKIQRHNFVCARLKKILVTCGFKVLVEQGASIHDRTRPGDLLVQNWEPGVDMYIDVSVIDPTGQSWRPSLLSDGAGGAARCKEIQKRKYYSEQFNLLEKRNLFCPFIVEAQGGVGKAALQLIRTMLKKKKELSLRTTTRSVKESEVTGGEILKKIVFESQRQMARTLMDKSSREDHILSKIVESRMLVKQATRKAAKDLRNEEIKLRPATVLTPVLNFKRKSPIGGGKKNQEVSDQSKTTKEHPENKENSHYTKNNDELIIQEIPISKIPSRLLTSKMRDLSLKNAPENKSNIATPCKVRKRAQEDDCYQIESLKMKLD